MQNPRHKRRNWFRLRNIVIVIALAIVACIGWILLEIRGVDAATPIISVNYREQFRQHASQVAGIEDLPASENSWRLLMESLNVANEAESDARADPFAEGFEPREENDDGYVDFSRVYRYADVPDIERETRALAMMQQRGVFDRLTELESLPPGLRPLEPWNGTSMMFEFKPYLARSRALAKALAASMRLAADGGRLGRAIEHFQQMLALAHTMSLGPSLIDYLVGMAIEALALGELRYLIIEHDLSEAELVSALKAIDRCQLPVGAFAFAGERASFHDFVQRTFSDDGKGNGYVCPSALANLDQTNPTKVGLTEAFNARFFMATRMETLVAYDTFVDAAATAARQPFGLLEDHRTWADAHIAALPKRLATVKAILPAIEKVLSQLAIRQVQWEGTRLMILIEQHQTRTGEWPARLDDLSSDALPHAPVDPLQLKPWGYRLLEGDEHGRRYALYSRGFDGEDDGGAHDPKDAFVAMRRDSSGVDFVINAPRERMAD